MKRYSHNDNLQQSVSNVIKDIIQVSSKNLTVFALISNTNRFQALKWNEHGERYQITGQLKHRLHPPPRAQLQPRRQRRGRTFTTTTGTRRTTSRTTRREPLPNIQPSTPNARTTQSARATPRGQSTPKDLTTQKDQIIQKDRTILRIIQNVVTTTLARSIHAGPIITTIRGLLQRRQHSLSRTVRVTRLLVRSTRATLARTTLTATRRETNLTTQRGPQLDLLLRTSRIHVIPATTQWPLFVASYSYSKTE